jgi:endonuclease III
VSIPWKEIIPVLRKAAGSAQTPSVTEIAGNSPDPYRVLVSTIISLRTRDKVTLESSKRLFAAAPDLGSLAALDSGAIAKIIYPAGFYRVKAGQLKRIAEELDGRGVPSEKSELLALPGVGIKTANLVLGLAFGIPAICVDTHVHRIPNRTGWIETSTPEASEKALEKVLPRKYWIEINTLLVAFGQQVCTPLSPRCGRCPLRSWCGQIGVGRFRD